MSYTSKSKVSWKIDGNVSINLNEMVNAHKPIIKIYVDNNSVKLIIEFFAPNSIPSFPINI